MFVLCTLSFVEFIQSTKYKDQRSTSPLQQINLINPNGFLVTVKRDHDAQSNRRFSRSHNDHKHREYLTRKRVRTSGLRQITGERNKIQIRGVENQLDRHEDDDDVASRQHARHSDDERSEEHTSE